MPNQKFLTSVALRIVRAGLNPSDFFAILQWHYARTRCLIETTRQPRLSLRFTPCLTDYMNCPHCCKAPRVRQTSIHRVVDIELDDLL